jgi:hypothetical protein
MRLHHDDDVLSLASARPFHSGWRGNRLVAPGVAKKRDHVGRAWGFLPLCLLSRYPTEAWNLDRTSLRIMAYEKRRAPEPLARRTTKCT